MVSRIANILLGVWLILAPRVLDYASVPARTNATWIGLAVIVTALVAFRAPEFIYVNVGLGAWLLLAPVLFQYGDSSATTNSVIVGILLVVAAAVGHVSRDIARRRVTPGTERETRVRA